MHPSSASSIDPTSYSPRAFRATPEIRADSVKSEPPFVLTQNHFVWQDRGPRLIPLCVRGNPEDWRLSSCAVLSAAGLGGDSGMKGK